MSIHIITESGSDFVGDPRENLTVLPMTITFNGAEYKDSVNLSHKEFYEKLIENDELPTTSQVAPYDFEEVIRRVTDAGDTALVITISGKLSGTYQSACIAASEFDKNVYVVDSENVTVGEKALIDYAFGLIDAGTDIETIVEMLNEEKKNIRVVALLDTLEYLKKGGRISKTVAFAGNILSIKPVVAVVDGEVAFLGKARGSKQGNNILAEMVNTSGIDFSKPYHLGYTGLTDSLLQKYIEDSEALWKDGTDKLHISTIGGTIGTHVGPGAIAVAFFAINHD